jgi:manganese/iron transport system substrate-binding protein
VIRIFLQSVFLLFMPVFLLAACSTSAAPGGAPEDLKIVASTSIVGDVVRQIAGQKVDLVVLIPTGSDPHTFEPRPQDIAAISEADIVFINGLGLEETLEPVLDANLAGRLVAVSDGIAVLPFEDDHGDRDEEFETGKHEDESDEYAAGDPHTWMDPNNVIVWVQNITAALAQVDPLHADEYQRNAEAYLAELRELDRWIRGQVSQVPPSQRKLVTDHAVFNYFAQEYGFELVGLVVPALSTNAAPSAKELAALEDEIRQKDVKAIFVGATVNPALSAQVAADTGAQVVFVYTGSLSPAGSGAETYLDFMRYNVSAIVGALK